MRCKRNDNNTGNGKGKGKGWVLGMGKAIVTIGSLAHLEIFLPWGSALCEPLLVPLLRRVLPPMKSGEGGKEVSVRRLLPRPLCCPSPGGGGLPRPIAWPAWHQAPIALLHL